jgi:hypothetical protein
VSDKERNGRLQTANVETHPNRVDKLIKQIRRVSQQGPAYEATASNYCRSERPKFLMTSREIRF